MRRVPVSVRRLGVGMVTCRAPSKVRFLSRLPDGLSPCCHPDGLNRSAKRRRPPTGLQKVELPRNVNPQTFPACTQSRGATRLSAHPSSFATSFAANPSRWGSPSAQQTGFMSGSAHPSDYQFGKNRQYVSFVRRWYKSAQVDLCRSSRRSRVSDQALHWSAFPMTWR